MTVKQISEADHSGDEKANFVINGVEAANVCQLLKNYHLSFTFFPLLLYHKIRNFMNYHILKIFVFSLILLIWDCLTPVCIRLHWLGWCLRKQREILMSVFFSMMERDESNAEDGNVLRFCKIPVVQ